MLTAIKSLLGVKVHACELPNHKRTWFGLEDVPKWEPPERHYQKPFHRTPCVTNWSGYISAITGVDINKVYDTITHIFRKHDICISDERGLFGEPEPSRIFISNTNRYEARKSLEACLSEVRTELSLPFDIEYIE